MNLPLSWLNELVKLPPDVTPHKFAADMTMSGSKVEAVHNLGGDIENVVVGKVISIEKHPDADKLSVCQINVGTASPDQNPIQIVTGAANVVAGAYVPVAMDGSTLPGGVKIKAGKLRGVPSNGMLCSIAELNLTLNDMPYAVEDGILLLKDKDNAQNETLESAIGKDIREVLSLRDDVIEFEITPNRPDCLSVIGLAREAAATYGMTYVHDLPKDEAGNGDITEELKVTIAAPELCARYTAKMIDNVKIEPSPLWLRARLRASGIRPINNIVDITNYVMLEYGQPMHAFDYACLENGQIIVRKAVSGEKIKTLDEKDRELTPDTLVIADSKNPVAVAGVMGGANSEITASTKKVVFESANFNGPSVRRASVALGMRTDSSGRFEKGLDPENTVPAVVRACQLVKMLGAGEVVGGIVDCYPAPEKPFTLPLEPEKINKLIGIDVSKDDMKKTLATLGFTFDGDEIIVPSWRADVRCMADVAEEVARIYGYDNIPYTVSGSRVPGALTAWQNYMAEASALCRGLGYSEALTYSFVTPTYDDMIKLPADSDKRSHVTIINPLGEDTSVMRTSMLPSMLASVSTNVKQRNASAMLYDLGKIYCPVDGELPKEIAMLTLGRYGIGDFFDFKGDVVTILETLGCDVSFTAVTDNPSWHPGRTAEISLNFRGKTIETGIIGQVHPQVCANFGIDTPVFVCQMNLHTIFDNRKIDKKFEELPKFPRTTRDLAVLCDEAVTAGQLSACITDAGGKLLVAVELFDIYTGSQIPAGKKSVAYSLSFMAKDRTLTDDEVDAAMAEILKRLESDSAR